MMDWRRPGRWLGTALVALLLAAPGEGQAQKSCDTCCQLPCVEAAIHTAEQMRALYYRLKIKKRLTQAEYEKAVDEERHRLGGEWYAAVGTLPQCEYNLPGKDDTMRIRELARVGWGVVESEDAETKGQLRFNISVHTDMEACTLNKRQLSLYKEIVSCTEIGAATEAHELKHEEQCKGRKKGQKDSTSVQAEQEMAAYDVELEHLRNLRKKLEKKCERESCKKKEATDQDAKALGKGLELMRAAQGKAGK